AEARDQRRREEPAARVVSQPREEGRDEVGGLRRLVVLERFDSDELGEELEDLRARKIALFAHEAERDGAEPREVAALGERARDLERLLGAPRGLQPRVAFEQRRPAPED